MMRKKRPAGSMDSSKKLPKKSPIRRDVIELIALLRKKNVDFVDNAIEFSKFCAKLQESCGKMIASVAQSPEKYGASLKTMRADLKRTSERLFVQFVKRYNTMADVSNSGDDKGWNPASVLFVVVCQCRYLSELCETASLVLYGRDRTTEMYDVVNSEAQFPSCHDELDDEVDRNVERLDKRHANMKPKKRKAFGGSLPTPFYPVTKSDAKRAFNVYTIRRDGAVKDDYRPLPLYWKPAHAPRLLRRGVFLFNPNIRIGEYTQFQVQMQLEKLDYHWRFFQVDDEELHTLLSALLLRVAEIICHKFVRSDCILDMGNDYDDHEVWEGMTISAESRSTTKQIVAKPDGTISYEDSPLVKTMKKQCNMYKSTIKQVSIKYIMEVGGIIRCLYKDILFYTENISSRVRRTQVCDARIQRALFTLLQKNLDLRIVSMDQHTMRKLQNYYNLEDESGHRPTLDEFTDRVDNEMSYMNMTRGGEYDDRDGEDDDDAAKMGRRATTKQMETFKEIVQETIMVEIRNKRDTSFIQTILKRIRVASVPYGARERYASNNEGIMNSSAMVQEQECSPAEMLAHRRNMWPVFGLDYFMERQFNPRIHSIVACSIFQSILFTMDAEYVWNDREKMTEITQADFRPCMIYDFSRDIELDSHTSLENVPRIVMIVGSFFIVYDNEFFYLKGGTIFDAIVYWILLFAENNFTRTLGQIHKKWGAFEYWVQRIMKQNTEAFISAQL